MSQHINSMLENLKMGGTKSKVSNGNHDSVDPNQVYKESNGVDEVDKISVVINDVKKAKNHVNNTDGVNYVGHTSDEKFDPRKRFSVPGGQNQNSAVAIKHGNGDIQHCSANKDLLASPRNMPRKLSQDLRRGINFPIDDGFDCSKYRKPVKLKSMISHYETYDSLHTKASEAPNQPLACNRSVCMGSVMFGANFQVAQNEIRKPDTIVEHAKNFLDQYFTSIRRSSNMRGNSGFLRLVVLGCLLVCSVYGGPPRPRRMMRETFSSPTEDAVPMSVNKTQNSDDMCSHNGKEVLKSSVFCEKKNGCREIEAHGECCPRFLCECKLNGTIYDNGDKIIDPENPCEVCVCRGGEINCNALKCYSRNDCKNVTYTPGVCCPEYANCPPLENVELNSSNETTTTASTVDHSSSSTMASELTTTTSLPTTSQTSTQSSEPPVGIKIKEITKPEEIRITDDRPKVFKTIKSSEATRTASALHSQETLIEPENESPLVVQSDERDGGEMQPIIEPEIEQYTTFAFDDSADQPIQLESTDLNTVGHVAMGPKIVRQTDTGMEMEQHTTDDCSGAGADQLNISTSVDDIDTSSGYSSIEKFTDPMLAQHTTVDEQTMNYFMDISSSTSEEMSTNSGSFTSSSQLYPSESTTAATYIDEYNVQHDQNINFPHITDDLSIHGSRMEDRLDDDDKLRVNSRVVEGNFEKIEMKSLEQNIIIANEGQDDSSSSTAAPLEGSNGSTYFKDVEARSPGEPLLIPEWERNHTTVAPPFNLLSSNETTDEHSSTEISSHEEQSNDTFAGDNDSTTNPSDLNSSTNYIDTSPSSKTSESDVESIEARSASGPSQIRETNNFNLFLDGTADFFRIQKNLWNSPLF